jgi:hypothetical protein
MVPDEGHAGYGEGVVKEGAEIIDIRQSEDCQDG